MMIGMSFYPNYQEILGSFLYHYQRVPFQSRDILALGDQLQKKK